MGGGAADGEAEDFAGDGVGLAEFFGAGKVVGGESGVDGGTDAGVEGGEDGVVAGEGGVAVGACEFVLDVLEVVGLGWGGVGDGLLVLVGLVPVPQPKRSIQPS